MQSFISPASSVSFFVILTLTVFPFVLAFIVTALCLAVSPSQTHKSNSALSTINFSVSFITVQTIVGVSPCIQDITGIAFADFTFNVTGMFMNCPLSKIYLMI